MLRSVLSHVLRALAHQVRHIPDLKAAIGSGSGYYRTKARVLKIEDGGASLPYRCVYRIDDTVAFEGADGTLLENGRMVEVVLEGGLLRSAATAWGKLTQVQFDTETRRQDASSADSSGYVGATFRLQPT